MPRGSRRRKFCGTNRAGDAEGRDMRVESPTLYGARWHLADGWHPACPKASEGRLPIGRKIPSCPTNALSRFAVESRWPPRSFRALAAELRLSKCPMKQENVK